MTDYRDPRRFRASYVPEHAAKERWGLLWPALVVLALLVGGILFVFR